MYDASGTQEARNYLHDIAGGAGQRATHNAAAFYRYRAPWGGDQDRKIDVMPSDQWGAQQDDAVAYWEQRHAVWRSLPYFDQINTAHAAMERRAGV